MGRCAHSLIVTLQPPMLRRDWLEIAEVPAWYAGRAVKVVHFFSVGSSSAC